MPSIGYRTHRDLMNAWDLLRDIAWRDDFADYCQFCHGCKGVHVPQCMIGQAQTLVVDRPEKKTAA